MLGLDEAASTIALSVVDNFASLIDHCDTQMATEPITSAVHSRRSSRPW
jgi:hypothetical protein